MRAFFGRYELCNHDRNDPECDGKRRDAPVGVKPRKRSWEGTLLAISSSLRPLDDSCGLAATTPTH